MCMGIYFNTMTRKCKEVNVSRKNFRVLYEDGDGVVKMSTLKTFSKESDFQASLIHWLRDKFPESIVLKNNPNYLQGIPDLLVLNGRHWAGLECKISKNAPKQPNQEFYITKMHAMSYARFVYPENLKEVQNELERALWL